MHRVDEDAEAFGIDVRRDAVAEVEHVARMRTETVQGRTDFGFDDRGLGVQHGGVDIALQRNAVADAAARFVEADRPVQAERRAAGVGECFEVPVRTFREHDERHVARDRIGAQGRRDLRDAAQRELLELRRAEHAAPGVEQHQRLGTRRGLCGEIRGDRARIDVEQAMHRGRIVPRERLDPREARRTSTLDHVARERPRAAREADQRQLAAEFAVDQAYRVHDVTEVGLRIGHAEFRDVRGAAQRPFEPWAFAFDESEAEAHRIRDRQDVGKQDRRVERKSREWLQGDLAREFGSLREREEAAGACARGAVFGQVATRLAHDPDRRHVDRLAPQRAQESVFGHGFLRDRSVSFRRIARHRNPG